MKVARRRGAVRLHLDHAEADVLAQQFDALAASLDEPLPAVRERLFPAGFRNDPQAAAEFRQLTEDALRATKRDRIGQCRAEIPAGGGDVQLDAEAVDRWLTVTNDVRLTLGTLLDVREDDDVRIDPGDPSGQQRIIYYWLTELQDSLVHAAMR